MNGILTGLFCLASLTSATYGQSCQPTPYEGDGGEYPKKPLTYKELDEVVLMGGNKSRPLYEVYNLQNRDFPSVLRKLVINWQKLPDGTYKNDFAGWFPDSEACYVDSLTFDRVDDGSKYVRLGFNIFFPEPIYHIGTMYSSCPDRYIISWHCQADLLDGKKCLGGTRMTILTFSESLDNLPWHHITADICKNKSPKLDEVRWTFTHEGTQCTGDVLPDPNGRKKREVKTVSRHELGGKSLWP